MKIRYAGKTDVGMKRAHNEDNILLVPEERLYLVADGMGGHASGEVASEMAVQTLSDFFEETSKDQEITWPYKMEKGREYEANRLNAGIKLSNLRIFESATQNPAQRGMGTTIVALLIVDDTAYFGHVGDSRIYRLREGKLTQVTEDHSLLNDYIKMKDLTEEEIENFPHKNVIVRALGMKETVQVDVNSEKPQPGDTYMLCSDGLNGMITDDVIRQIMVDNYDDLEQCCTELIDAANANGGTDNITVAVVQIA
ncbi:Stp1/IreP family PP2C-type Ser/Thr phosphatase [Bradymonas sediminis]|uniref:Stp1/IreP family PP2C-type Ser/Thr phosphatase n=1 Tax=Bradymonas sediminis TaxID=1548548 RepID=A0A2Z4FRX3_9DELT|nr:Stp1/IreP family PP2C-type Ser/Thr phosphatase [Bradymonas sediminis]